MVVKEESYTAASAYPIKILLNPELVKSIGQGVIPPVHVQLNPTNKCNLNCEWCSCSARDREQELSYEEIVTIMTKAWKYGCRAVTITGGGEPLMHPKINEMIDGMRAMGIEIGFVTNGWLFGKLETETLNKITWCRISLGDGRDIEKKASRYWNRLENTVNRGRRVDWSFSYVVTAKPDYELMKMMISFANVHNFTHIRLVSDIFVAGELRDVMAEVKEHMRLNGIDDRLVIYQDRGTWTPGTKDCYIRFLKPVVGADGYLYPCCGTQYALAKPGKDYEKTMRMGKAVDIDKFIEQQKDPEKQKVCASCGTACVKCYYDNYNQLLKILKEGVEHRVFV